VRKVLVLSLGLFVVVIAGALLSVRFFPQVYIAAYNKFSSEKAVVDTLDVGFWPLSIKANSLSLSNSKGEKFVSVDSMVLSAQLIGWIKGKNNFWSADVASVDVQLHRLPESSSSDSSDQNTALEKLNFHRILSKVSLQAKEVRVQLDDSSYLSVNHFNTHLNDDDLLDYRLIEQDINFSFEYVNSNTVEKSLSFEGVLQSRIKDGVSNLGLAIPSLDLSSILVSESEVEIADDKAQELNSVETAIDWQWLELLEPIELDLTIGEIVWSKSSLREVNLVLSIDESISFTQKANVSWLESEQLSFEDTITLSGQWQPISSSSLGPDLRGQTQLSITDLDLGIEGEININGSEGNSVSIALEGSKIPIESAALNDETLTMLEQYFPLKMAVDVKQTENAIDLNINNAQFGKSDAKGSHAEVDIESETVGQGAPAEVAIDNTKSEQTAEKDEDGKARRVFSDSNIDWSFLEQLALDFDWQVQTLSLDNIEVSNLKLPISVLNGELIVNGLSGGLAEGTFEANANLAEKDNAGTLNFTLEASNIVLEKLKLLPPEELKRGVSNISIKLGSKGNNPQTLASSLNGFVKINVGDGVIGNDSFELIGSDLILSLLNKLNPFSKEDKTTELECAVVNLKIDDGKINIDKSLAVRTSKLTMVADGYVDLGSEKIKLGLTPKARSGVGVDVSSLVKFIALGGSLAKPAPTVTASGLLKSAIVVGAAVSTGGASLLATSAAEKTVAKVDVCKRADKAFQ